MARRYARSAFILATIAALSVGGCETLNSLNPFGGSKDDGKTKEQKRAEKYDERPRTRDTGDIPADIGNREYSDEDLRAE